ncbi:hypothetical protein DSECCO2_265720 [anaerobic digester metagenome]
MAVKKIAIISFEKVLVKLLVLVPTHASVEAIDRMALGGHVKEDLTRFRRTLHGFRSYFYRMSQEHDIVHILQSQVCAV